MIEDGYLCACYANVNRGTLIALLDVVELRPLKVGLNARVNAWIVAVAVVWRWPFIDIRFLLLHFREVLLLKYF